MTVGSKQKPAKSQNRRLRVLRGNCSKWLDKLPDASIDCCVTSPPYYNLRKYTDDNADEVGREGSPEAYIKALVAIFNKVKRVLKPDGTLWLVIGDCYLKKDRLLIPARVALALQADGWIIRDEVIWHKPRTTPTPVKDRTCAAHEMVYCFSLGPKYYYDFEGIEEPSKNAGRVVKYNGKQKNTGLVEKAPGSVARNITIRATRRKRSVWSVSPQASKSMHTATFPIDLITPMIVAGCPIGGTVLDPFGGMGTTGLVAQSLKRKAILIELNPSYAKLSLERIQADRK